MSKVNREDVYTTGEISKKLGFGVSTKFLKKFIEPAADMKKSMAVYWWKRDFCLICDGVMQHIQSAQTDDLEVNRTGKKNGRVWIRI